MWRGLRSFNIDLPVELKAYYSGNAVKFCTLPVSVHNLFFELKHDILYTRAKIFCRTIRNEIYIYDLKFPREVVDGRSLRKF